jgi:serine/threonine protein kinase
MMELLGRMPKNMALSGKSSRKYFSSQGHLRKISGLHFWPLSKVLIEKYHFRPEEAEEFANFLLPMLRWEPDKRATAQQMLQHPWFTRKINPDYKLTEKEQEVMRLKAELKGGVAGKLTRSDSVAEMNELIESDEEMNAADADEKYNKWQREYDSGDAGQEGDKSGEEEEEPTNEDSFLDSEGEAIEDARRKKIKEVKLNNSFTGPYPQDPADFSHKDKGSNYQFEHIK